MARMHPIVARINAQWDSRSRATDWLGLEQILVDILKEPMSAEAKVVLSKEAIDAFTRRGHFDHTNVDGHFGVTV